MNKNFTRFSRFMLFLVLLLSGFAADAQLTYLTTVPPYNGGNSSALTTFNVKASRKIRIKEVYNCFTSAASQTVTLWYKTDSINTLAANAVSTSNGWIQAGVVTFTPTPTGAGNICLIPFSSLAIVIPSGATYGFAISTTGSITYTGSGSAPVSPWLLNDQSIHINMGTAVGYGGTIASPIQYRQFNGKLGYEIVPIGPNNAGVAAITEPSGFCSGTYNVKARIRNNGTNQLSQVNVKWAVDSILQSTVYWTSLIDTFGGSFPNDTVITLGSLTWPSGSKKFIKVWTELPNNVADTVNADDTVSTWIGTSMAGTFQIGGSTPDYATLSAFANDVNARGLCGPVTAVVNPGTYSGKAAFNSPLGLSASNTITVMGTNKSTCILSDSTADAILAAYNCSYTTFRNLTVINRFTGACFGIGLIGNAGDARGSNSTVKNCIVSLPNTTTSPATGIIASAALSGSNNKLDSIVIDSNNVTGGYYGIMLYGNTGASNTQNRGHRMSNNTVVNAYYYGIYMYYIYNPTMVLNNDISMNPANTGASYALYYYYCQNSNTTTSTRIIGNIIRNPGYFGMYIYYNASTATAPTKIYNNAVFGNMQYSTNYGCYLYTGVAATYEYMHNTIHVNGSGTTQYGLYYYNTANVSGLLCKNNIFSIYSSAGTTVYPAYFSSNPVGNLINYNIYYNARNTTLGYRGAAFTTANFNTITTGGDSSFNRSINVVSNQDVHLTDGCVRGTDLSGYVSVDRDNVTRSTAPSIGAYEYVTYPLDLTIDKIYTPVMPVTPGSQNVVVRIRNNGSTAVTAFTAGYILNNGTPVTQAVYTTLASCDTMLVTFSGANQITIGSGMNNIKVFTAQPNSSADGNTNNDTLRVSYNYLPPMNGTYTIGGTGASFPGFAEAFLALQTAGVNGPVTFIVNPGTYTGAYTLNAPVYGVSATNNITIDGVNAATRIISANAGAPALMINQVSYVTVKNLTIINANAGSCTGLALIGNASDRSGTGFVAKNNVVSLPNVGTNTSYGIVVTGALSGIADGVQYTDSVTIDSNTVVGGYYGIQISTSTTGNALYNRGHRVRYNTLNSVYYYGIRVAYIFNPVDIISNTVNMLPSNTSSYGIYFYYNQNSNPVAASRVIGNYVYAGYVALYHYYFTSPLGTPIQVYNNMFVSYGTSYASYTYSAATGGGELNIYHNTYRTNGAATYGLYYYNNNSTGTSYFKNNIFYATANATYPAYFSTNPTGNVINYNNYYNAGGGNLGYRGAAFTTANFNTTTTGGDSSFNVLPNFTSATNLHLENGCLRGVDLTAFVSNDIDNNIRSNPPVIGAHEASSTANDIALEYVYTSAPVLPGYQDIALRVRNNKSSSTTGLMVGVQINGGTPLVYSYNGTVNGCDTANILLTGSYQMNLPAGFNLVKVYIYTPGGSPDPKNTNDTITMVMSTINTAPGNCFTGNGTGGRNIRFPNRSSMNTLNGLTVEAWVNLPTPTANQKLVCKSSTGNGWVLGVQNGGIYPEVWTAATGATSITLTAGTIPANTWTHLALTWQSGVGLKAYINGSQVGAVLSATSTTNTASNNDLTIGTNSWDFGHASTGNIDEVRVWNYALDSVMLRKNMHRTLKGNEGGLVSYVQMNEPSAFPAVCDPISGATGTKNGAGIISTSNVICGSDTSLIATGVTSGSLNMYGMSVTLVSPFTNACDVVALEIPYAPNALPSSTYTLSDRYWVLNVFGNPGTGYFGNMSFTLPPFQINSTDTGLSLYNRSPYSNGAWTKVQTATTSAISSGAVTFFGISNFGQFTLASNGNSPLPVNFLDFGATAKGDLVLLNWHTASERNNQGFEVQRATGNGDYEVIGFVKSSAVNSTSVIAYNYTDATADRSQLLRYRLKQVDMNGGYSYSPVAAVEPNVEANIEVAVYPNPFLQRMVVKGLESGTEVTMTDLNGKELHRETVSGQVHEMHLPSGLHQGVYFLRTSDQRVIKVVRQ